MSIDKQELTTEEAQDDAIIGRALVWSLAVIAVVGVVAGGVAYWMTREAPIEHGKQTKVEAPQTRDDAAAEIPKLPFTDITQQAGIDFVHFNGATGEKMLPETMGGGCAFFDYDNDGDQDLLLINSTHWPWSDPPEGDPPTMALYRNDGTGKFDDATKEAGLDLSLYGMGVAIGDYDGDGWRDVYITAVGANRLLRNNEGKFVDVTESTGTAGEDDRWSTSCGWFDYDADGDLDLVVCNYVVWSRKIDLAQDFKLVGIGRAYGPPTTFAGTQPYLFRNDGGKFTEVAAKAGLHVLTPDTQRPMAKSLGVAITDLDHDGRLDLVIANDTVQNFVFRNLGEGKFEEIGTQTGIAFDSSGKARGAMGIDAAHFRNDQTLGVAIGNFAQEMTAFYVSLKRPLLFADAAIATGLGPPTRLDLTFGLFFFDADLDGRVDLFSANGHLESEIERLQISGRASQHYRQPPKLFYNTGGGSSSEFVETTPDQTSEDFARPIVGRGAAYADIDADGDLDVLITAIGDRPRLLRNDQNLGHHWLRVKLTGKDQNRDAIGALVEVHTADRIHRARVMPTRSYLSQVELPVTIGLGESDQVEKVVVTWPDGTTSEVTEPAINQLMEMTQP